MIKLARVAWVLVSYVATCGWLLLTRAGTAELAACGTRHAQRVLRALNITVRVRGDVPRSGVVVANHLSYVDILALLSLIPGRFVTFTEMGKVLGIGTLTKLSQAILVNRSTPARVRRDVALFEGELKKGGAFIFFPEGSSFEGDELRPFRAALFESAIRTRTEVHPVCLRYLELEGAPVTRANRHRIFYYGDMELIAQLLRLLRVNSLTVEVVFCAPIDSTEMERKELANLARAQIAEHFLAVPS